MEVLLMKKLFNKQIISKLILICLMVSVLLLFTGCSATPEDIGYGLLQVLEAVFLVIGAVIIAAFALSAIIIVCALVCIGGIITAIGGLFAWIIQLISMLF